MNTEIYDPLGDFFDYVENLDHRKRIGTVDKIAFDECSASGTAIINDPKLFELLTGLHVESKREKYREHLPERVVYSNGVTTCIWKDGTKTQARTHDGDDFDKTTGLMLCAIKKWMPGGSYWFDALKDLERDGKVDDQSGRKNRRQRRDEARKNREEKESSARTRFPDYYHRGLAYTDDEKQEALEKVQEGKSLRQVSRETGISQACLSNWCDEFGIKLNRGRRGGVV